jgi:hypothetical protein
MNIYNKALLLKKSLSGHVSEAPINKNVFMDSFLVKGCASTAISLEIFTLTYVTESD